MGEVRVTKIGGPSLVFDYAGTRLAVDPTFDPPREYRQGPVTLTKLAGPSVTVDEVGPVDGVLISHDQHPDNLDHAGREFALAAPRIVTTDVGARRLGDTAIGLRPYQHTQIGPVRITATPALHGNAESGLAGGPVIGFVLEADGEPAVYVSGDNASVDVVSGIVEQFPHIEIAVLFIGAAKVAVRGDAPLTLTAERAARAAALLDARVVVPAHQDGWAHFTQHAEDVELAFADAGLAKVLVDLKPGDTVTV